MSSARGFLGLALVMTLAGCPEALRVEGTEPSDCTDGADNDADGLFDCDDPTCSGSPACRGRADGGSGDGGSSDGGLSDGGRAADAFVATDAALVAEDAGSEDAFLMDAPSVDAFSSDAFSADAFSADVFSADVFSADVFSLDAFSADAFSPDAFSADAFSPDAFSPDAARSPNGASCMTSSTCASGFCVDSVCCNTECTGTCTACTVARRGSGSDGTCGVISAGTDPDDECAASPASSCGNDGSCNGAGACRLWAAGTVCAPAGCASGLESRPDTCNGTGTCSDGGTVACTPYVCGGSACLASCASGSECVSGHTCIAGACYPAYALRIPDASSRIIVRDTTGLFTDAFTWETWAVFTSNAYSDPPQSLMQVVDLNPGNPYALVYLRALYNRLDCVVGTGTGETVVSTPLGGISTGVPHHIACTRSATEQVLWVDGVRVGSVAPGPFPHPADGTWLALGGDFRTPAEPYTFRGTIDEVRISSVARYTGAGPFVPARRHTVDASTLALWHFDEGVGTVTDNAAGTGRDGTIEGAVWVAEP